MSEAEYVPSIGEQFNSTWKRKLSYHGKDMKFFTDKSHFKHPIALQCGFYGVWGVGRQNKGVDEKNFKSGNENCIGSKEYKTYRELVNYPKEQTLITDSVDYTETIIIRERGAKEFFNVQIGEFVDMFLDKNKKIGIQNHEYLDIKNIEVLTIDDNYKVVWKLIQQVIRHKVKKQCLEISTLGGKSVSVTKDHSIIQFKDINSLSSIECKKLKKNDYVISYDKLVLPEKDIEKFDIEVKYFNKKKIYTFYITELELKILGYIVGNGYISNVGLGISGMTDKNLKELFIKFCKKYNVNPKFYYNKHDASIVSRKLSRVLHYLGFCGYAYTKTIPDWVLNLSKQKLGWFLSGYFSVDGYIMISNENKITQIGVRTVSKKLHLDTKLALDKLGIKYNSGVESAKSQEMFGKIYNCKKSYYISIYDVQSFNIFKKYIIFHNKEKQKKLLESNTDYYNKLQQANLPCDIVKDYCKFENQDFITKDRVNHKISKSDIGCFRIKHINKTNFTTDYVYDISVEGVERFLCSGILVHNSAGFQIASFKKRGEEAPITSMQSLRWQEANATEEHDIAMNLDIPPNLDGTPTYEEFNEALKTSVKNFQFFKENRKNYKMKLYNVLHGESIPLINKWYNAVKDFNFDGWAVGLKPPFDAMIQALGMCYLWEKGELTKDKSYGMHIFGTSGKLVVPTIVYMANKLDIRVTYDSSSYNIGSIYRTYYLPFDHGPNLSFGEKFKRMNPHLKKLPCKCPVCKTIKSIDDLNKVDIYAGTLISLHNMWQYIDYNDILNSLVSDKDKFIEYIQKIIRSEKTLKSIEFIDFAMEKGVEIAVKRFEKWLIPDRMEKTKQVGIYGFT